jgi:hypothetical protein
MLVINQLSQPTGAPSTAQDLDGKGLLFPLLDWRIWRRKWLVFVGLVNSLINRWDIYK